MFWKKDRNKEQQEQAEKIQTTTKKNRDLQSEVKKLQEQIAEQAKTARQQAMKTQGQAMQKLQQEVTKLRQKVQSAEQRAQSQREPDVDLEELPAEQQRAARTDVEQELREANKRIDELEQELSQTGGKPTGMAVGSTAWVRKAGGQGLNRRDAPGLNSNVQDSLAIGTQLTLQEGPVQADGYTWWRVQADDGRVGWVAGEELVTQPE